MAEKDHKGLFKPGEAAEYGRKGGKASNKRKGFGSDPERARQAALKGAETKRRNRERNSGGVQA